MENTYDLESLKLPRVGGRALAALAAVAEGPLRGMILGSLLKNAGVLEFRRRVVEEAPSCRRSRCPRATPRKGCRWASSSWATRGRRPACWSWDASWKREPSAACLRSASSAYWVRSSPAAVLDQRGFERRGSAPLAGALP